ELASGQVINKDKSSVLFSPNISNHTKQQMRAILSINQEAKSEKYLGLPGLGVYSRMAGEVTFKGRQGNFSESSGTSHPDICDVLLFLPSFIHPLDAKPSHLGSQNLV
ncbi:hypothetical protein U9M48_043588, partial [Paspalum notatum var. saurae]